MPNPIQAAAEGLPKFNRRRFLLNTAAVGAAVAVVAPSAAAQPELTPREQAIWHLRELERLIIEDGAVDAHIIAIGTYSGGPKDCKLVGIHYTGRLMDKDGMFAEEVGAA